MSDSDNRPPKGRRQCDDEVIEMIGDLHLSLPEEPSNAELASEYDNLLGAEFLGYNADEVFYTREELARILRVTPRHTYAYERGLNKHKVPLKSILLGQRVMFARSDVLAFIEKLKAGRNKKLNIREEPESEFEQSLKAKNSKENVQAKARLEKMREEIKAKSRRRGPGRPPKSRG